MTVTKVNKGGHNGKAALETIRRTEKEIEYY